MRFRIRKLLKKPEVVFATLAISFGLFSAVMVPQLSVSDENMHFRRAYTLASGDLGTNKCTFPYDVNLKAYAAFEGRYSANYRDRVDTTRTVQASCGSAAGYSPIVHIPQAVGIFLAKLVYPSTALMVLLGRIFNLAFYAIALYFVIKHVRLGRWAYIVIGLFPGMVHFAASLSGDVVNNVVVLAYIAFLLNLFVRKTKLARRDFLMLLVLSCTVALTKSVNILLLLPLLFLPSTIFAKNKGWSQSLPINFQKWTSVPLIGALSALSIIGWQKIYGASLFTPAAYNPLTDRPLHFLDILSNTYISPFIGYNDIVLRGVIGEFSSFQYHSPTFMLILSFFLLLIALLYSNNREETAMKNVARPLILSTIVALGLLVIAVTYALYVGWAIQPFRLGPTAPYADGVQGRYFTAFLALLIPLFIWLRRFMSFRASSEKTFSIIVYSVATFSLLFYSIETYLIFT